MLKDRWRENLSIYRIAVFGLIIAGFGTRLYLLNSIPLWHDETVMANAIISFLETGAPNLPSGYMYWRAFPYTLISAVPASLLGASDITLRFSSAVVGSLTVGLVYLVGRDLFDKETGFIAAVFTAFSAWAVAWSIQVRMYVLLQFLYLAAVFLTYRVGEDFNRKNFLLLTSTILLAIFTHVTAYILPFIAAFYITYRKRWFRFDQRILLPATLILLTLAISEIFYFSYLGLLNQLTFTPDHFELYLEWMVEEIPVLFSLGFLGALLNLRENLETSLLTGIFVFPVFYIYSFHVGGINNRYLYFMMPFLALWTALVIERVSKKLYEKTEIEIDRKYLAALLTLGLLLMGSGFDYNYSEEGYMPHMTHEYAFEYVESHDRDGDILITQWTAPALYYYRAPEYSLFGGEVRSSEYSFNGTDMYSGSEFIDSNEKLVQVIEENKRGWIVLHDTSYRFKPSEMQQTISALEKEAEFDTMSIWSWNSTSPGNWQR